MKVLTPCMDPVERPDGTEEEEDDLGQGPEQAKGRNKLLGGHCESRTAASRYRLTIRGAPGQSIHQIICKEGPSSLRGGNGPRIDG
jgi:hypothetical protein